MDFCLRYIGGACCLGSPRDAEDDDDLRRPLWPKHQNDNGLNYPNEKSWPLKNPGPHMCISRPQADDDLDNIPKTAAQIVSLLQTATSRAAVDADEHVQKVRQRLHEEDNDLAIAWNPQWKQNLAEAVLERLVETAQKVLESANEHIEHPKETLRDIVQWARWAATEVFEWTEEHPHLAMCLALAAAVAVAWVLVPWVLEAVGFGELGPVAESVAARLQMRYMGHVPKGSWFSFFQRLGMVWGK
ncbi:hypothetical protein SCUCBS95973_002182 [Sporothrix curviconia]|uniref:Uncharacterized protein n=1 Tax=Sporothrix curviconia TaxID=1260050 RepID=A0ABP0B4Q6_9PEZI